VICFSVQSYEQCGTLLIAVSGDTIPIWHPEEQMQCLRLRGYYADLACGTGRPARRWATVWWQLSWGHHQLSGR